MLHNWQERVIQEKRDLDVRLANLQAFIASDDCTRLDNYARDLLHQQVHYMRAYSQVLANRIELFTEHETGD